MTPEERIAAGLPVMYSPEEAVSLGILPGLTVNWLKRQAGRGAIPCTRLGRVIMFSAADLTEIARRGARKPQGDAPAAEVTPITKGQKAPAAGSRKLQPREPRSRRGAA
jgi:hypothetical protein